MLYRDPILSKGECPKSLRGFVVVREKMMGMLSRRIFGALCSVSLLAPLVAGGVALADDYPSKSIELVVGFPPGGASDFAARVIAEGLTRTLKQPVVVVNRPGASSSLGADYVKRAAPDGYTLFLGTSDSLAVYPAVKAGVTYEVPGSFTFISKVAEYPLVFAVGSKRPYKTMKAFVDFAKSNPAKFNYGSAGVGSGGHLEAVRMGLAAGVDITHVPYKGSAGAATDLMNGTVDGLFGVVKEVSAFVASGDVTILGVTSRERDPLIPNVPTFAEAGLGAATFYVWSGVLGPANMPSAVVDKLNAAVVEVMARPDVKERFAATGLTVSTLPKQEFAAFAGQEFQAMKKLSDDQNIKITE